ncbi:uncharacterized protein LOC108227838 isoform X1 [Daucus carota subsp. sativus]|uniref:uncharacterized protein LOC108227837 isoform X1 n=1 Tax=Daucus carota subsp. sativus TaxID=79200 RepID=UPI003082B2F8
MTCISCLMSTVTILLSLAMQIYFLPVKPQKKLLRLSSNYPLTNVDTLGQSTLLQAPGYDDIPKEIQAGADVKKKLLISSLVAKDPAMKVNWNLDGPAEGADGLL